MATEATFNAAATIFDDQATALQSAFRTLDGSWAVDVMTGGRLTRTFDLALDATSGNVTSSAGQLFELAEECRRRAIVCAEYSAAMSRYRNDLATHRHEVREFAAGNRPGSPPRPPSQPVRPAPWCDETTGQNRGWR